ncbi:hypothetical protein BH11ACT7_BH11ACT7_00860 [soil metagenome]
MQAQRGVQWGRGFGYQDGAGVLARADRSAHHPHGREHLQGFAYRAAGDAELFGQASFARQPHADLQVFGLELLLDIPEHDLGGAHASTLPRGPTTPWASAD